MRKTTTLILVGTFALSAVVGTLFALLGSNSTNSSSMRLLAGDDISPEVEKEFNKFASKHHKSYLTKEEYKARLSAFKSNYDLVKSHDAAKEGFELGLNKFSDWTMEEYSKILGNNFVDTTKNQEDDEDEFTTWPPVEQQT